MEPKTILMIEDNPTILRTNRAALELAGYRTLAASTLAEGKQAADRGGIDLILLDILLPDGSGLDYCRELFGQGGPRILFLSALGTKADVIAGLRAGGDDYITKPYLMDELLARVEALLRRDTAPPRQEALRLGRLEIDTTTGRALLDGADLLLTPRELALLSLLLQNPGQYLPPAVLYRAAWGMEAVDTRPVKQHIRSLRQKLSGAPAIIESVRGRGYRLVSDGEGIENLT